MRFQFRQDELHSKQTGKSQNIDYGCRSILKPVNDLFRLLFKVDAAVRCEPIPAQKPRRNKLGTGTVRSTTRVPHVGVRVGGGA